jgi:hypothetical protein
MRWICRGKLVPIEGASDEKYPDVPESIVMAHGGNRAWNPLGSPTYIVEFGNPDRGYGESLTPDEEVEMRKRGNVPESEADTFTERAPRRSDGRITGLSVDGSTRISDARTIDHEPRTRDG